MQQSETNNPARRERQNNRINDKKEKKVLNADVLALLCLPDCVRDLLPIINITCVLHIV